MLRGKTAIPVPLGGFSPVDLVGLQLWLDGSDIATLWQDSARTTPVASDGDVIGAQDDKSGNDRHAVQATTTNKPVYKAAIQNGLSVIRCDGVKDYLQTASFSLTQPEHVFIVAKMNASGDFLMDGLSVNTGSLWSATTTSLRLYAGTALTNTNLALATFHLFTQKIDGVSSSNQIDLGAAATGDAGAADLDGVTVGASGGIAAPLSGDVCELLIYKPLLSAGDETLVQNYLIDKWGL